MSATRLCTYRYDPLDRLTCHSVMTLAPVQRFYCMSRLATEIEGAISRSIVQHGDQLLAQSETQGSAKQGTLLATDQQRSVLHAVSANERQSHAYSPYGNRTIGNGFLSLLGFNGERPDPVTGHYLLGNGYRAFNPVLMRFNSPDKLSPFGKGGINSYAYCSCDPINWSDPNGRMGISSLRNLARAARPRIHLSGPEVVFRRVTRIYTEFIEGRKGYNNISKLKIFTGNDFEVTAKLIPQKPTLTELALSKTTDFSKIKDFNWRDKAKIRKYSLANLYNHLNNKRTARSPYRLHIIYDEMLTKAKSGHLRGVHPTSVANINNLEDRPLRQRDLDWLAKLREDITKDLM